MSRPQATVTPGLDRLEGEGKLGEERQDVADHEQLARGRGGRHHLVGFGRLERDRLFDQHVLAGLERLDGHPAVGVVGNAEIDQVDLRDRPATPRSRGSSHAGEIHLAARGPKLPWMLVQSPASFLGSRLHRATTLPRRLCGGEVMDHAHEADADDADAGVFASFGGHL